MSSLSAELRTLRDSRGLVQKKIAMELDLSESQLSDYVNGKARIGIDLLIPIAEAFGMQSWRALELWVIDGAKDSKTKELLTKAFSEGVPAEASRLQQLLSALENNADVAEAGKSVVRAMQDTMARVLEALGNMSQLRACGDKRTTTVSIEDERQRWTPLHPASQIKTKRLFRTKRPTGLMFELQRFPPMYAGIHRQPHRPGYFELWSASEGTGLLLVKEEEVWEETEVKVGRCGYYWSGYLHVWINPSPDSPLTVFQGFFPYRRERLEGWEFKLPDLPADLPPDAAAEIRRALRKYPEIVVPHRPSRQVRKS